MARGEVDPALYGRVDQIAYDTGLRTCRNCIVQKQGGAFNRPGTEWVGWTIDSAAQGRIRRWRFNNDQTYILEFGNLKMRVIKQGAQVEEASFPITAITQAVDGVVTATGHNFVAGDHVNIASVEGMTQVNGRTFRVGLVSGDDFQIQDPGTGSNINTEDYTAYSSGGTAARIYEIATPFVTADLQTLQFEQSGDILTITHPNYPPQELARTGDTAWTLTEKSFVSDTARPGSAAVSSPGGPNSWRYKVTAVNQITREEGPAWNVGTARAITGATQANPCRITIATTTPYEDGDTILIEDVVGMVELNNREYEVIVVDGTHLDLRGVDSTNYGAYVSGGNGYETFVNAGASTDPTPSAPHVLTWDPVPGASEYNVYRAIDGFYGFIGVAGYDTFDDINYTPDLTRTPPFANNPFVGPGNYPSVSAYFQQRQLFANTDNAPEDVWATEIGNFKNLSLRDGTRSKDSIRFTLAGREVHEILHMIDVSGRLVILTTNGEWAILGDADGSLTPSAVNARQHTYNGASPVPPVVINNTALYLQGGQTILRDLFFTFDSDSYQGNDLTVEAAHLFRGYTIVDMDYQRQPDSIVWLVRSDGVLLSLTYLREHRLFGWARHDFQGGAVENVAVVREGDKDRVYVTVRRTINGNTVRYIERLADREYTDIRDAIFMDSALSYDGRNADPAHTQRLANGVNWDYTETLDLFSTVPMYGFEDIGNEIQLTGADGKKVRFKITTWFDEFNAQGKVDKTAPESLRDTPTANWAYAVNEIGNLWHLEGEDVSVIGDGFVDASPHNPQVPTRTVQNGTVELGGTYAVIHAGLPYRPDIETLDIDAYPDGTIMHIKKNVTSIALRVHKTRGVFMGPPPDDPEAADATTGLVQVKELVPDPDLEEPPEEVSDVVKEAIPNSYDSHGRVFIRQVDPLPLGVLSVVPIGYIPARGK